MVRLGMVLTVAVAFGACSQGAQPFTGENPKETDPFMETAYLTLVGFTGSIVKREKRFSGYSKTAGRVSLIDPAQEEEVWGRQLEGSFDLTAPLPDYSGVALLSGRNLSIVGPGTEKHFAAIEFPIGYIARASDSATYAVVSDDGLFVRVIHQLQSGEWQEETFESPFSVPPGFSTPPDSDPPLGVALLSGDGNRMIFFKPSDGSYAFYASEVAGGPISAEPKKKCTGENVGMDSQAIYRALAYDDRASLAVAGNRQGLVSVFDPAADCVAPRDRPSQNLGDNLPVIDITVTSQGRVAVTQVGGRLHTMAVLGDGFQDLRSISDVCNYPLGALPVGQDGMALVCVDAKGVDTVTEKTAAPASVNYEKVFVQVVSLVSGLPIFQRPLDVEDTAGAALDPDLGRVLILKDSAIGILNVLDLATGEQHSRKGIFLDGILD